MTFLPKHAIAQSLSPRSKLEAAASGKTIQSATDNDTERGKVAKTQGGIGMPTITVIDDEPGIIKVITRALERRGLIVSSFTSPYDALNYFESNFENCDLVVSDLRMPGMPGFELVRNIRRINQDIPILIMTAQEIDEKEMIKEIKSSKIGGMIRKPFSPKQFADMVVRHNNNAK